jgi:peptidoglycan/xylan/chitin deacetylase (PgdA/CDA1 family)
MTGDELRRLAGSRWVTIGAHTVTHTPLSILSEERQREEIVSSKIRLETLLGTEIKVFSYPFGRKSDYNRASVRICREAGFIKAASNFPGQAHRWTDPYQLPRQLVRNWGTDTFAAKVKDFWL